MSAIIQTFQDIFSINLLIATAFALPSGIVQGYAGFGGALLAVPLFTLLFGPVAAFSIVVILMFVGQAFLFSRSVQIADWREVAPLSIASAVTMSLGILFLVRADPGFIRQGMAVFILLITVSMMLGWQYKGGGRRAGGIVTGAFAGGVTGSFGVPAFPLCALYFHTASSPAEIIRANVLTALACNLVVSIIGLTIQRVYDTALVLQAFMILPVFMSGIYIGQFLFRIAPVTWFRQVTYAILIIAALTLLVA